MYTFAYLFVFYDGRVGRRRVGVSGLSPFPASPSSLKRPTLVFVTLVGFDLRGRSDWMEILFRIRSSPALGSRGVGGCAAAVYAHYLRVDLFALE